MKQPPGKQHYHDVSKKVLAPAATLAFSLEKFNNEYVDPMKKVAIDLGFGNGIDSVALLADWLAIDCY